MASSKSLARKTHSEQWWANHAPAHVVRCTATLRSTGTQCRREAVPGMNVCGNHGGHLPSNVAAAFTRLGDSVEKAADTIAEIMADTEVPARDRLTAAQHVMKLLGMEKERVDVKVSVDPVEALFRQIAADPDGLAPPSDGNASPAELAERQQAWADLIGEDVVDAEVVEDPSEDTTPARIEVEASPPTDSAKMPKHIREGLERRELLRRLL